METVYTTKAFFLAGVLQRSHDYSIMETSDNGATFFIGYILQRSHDYSIMETRAEGNAGRAGRAEPSTEP